MLMFLYKWKYAIKTYTQKYKTSEPSIKTSKGSHIFGENFLFKVKITFGIYAVFEADNESDVSILGIKTTNIYKQTTACSKQR